MDVYLLRHGDALPVGSEGIRTDDERTLSDEGRREIREVAASLQRLKVDPDAILSSPLIRARETADIVAQEAGKKEVTSCDELGHGFSPAGLLARLRELPRKSSLILVGHQPDLGSFASFLLTGDANAIDISLKKGGLCWIEFDNQAAAGKGTLRWLLTQKHLRVMATGR
jgi:phosphohistidine phosphatase